MFVLDEVDFLLLKGFEPQVSFLLFPLHTSLDPMFLLTLLQVRSIVECLPRLRQNLMFSATIPPRIEKMASEMMTNPVFISVGVVIIIISV